MTQFSSISPIPGFRDWLMGEINRELHRKSKFINTEVCKFRRDIFKENRWIYSLNSTYMLDDQQGKRLLLPSRLWPLNFGQSP